MTCTPFQGGPFTRSLGDGPFYEHLRGVSAANPDILLDLDFTTTSLPSEVDNYSRASVCAPVTGTNSRGVVVTKFSSGAYAYAYHPAFSHTSKTGMLSEAGATNLVDDSEICDSVSNGTLTANAEEAPDGTTTADLIEGAGAGYQRGNWGAGILVNTTAYVVSFFAKRPDSASSDQNSQVKMDVNAATLAFTATSEWQRFEMSFTATVTATHKVEIECDTVDAPDGVVVWGVQVEAGTKASSYIPTSGATASRARTAVHIANANSNDYIRHAQGQVDCVYVPTQVQSTDQYYWRFSNASGSNDRKQLRSNGGGNWRVNNTSGTLVIDVSNGAPDPKSADAEYTRKAIWDSNNSPFGKTIVDADTDTGGSGYTEGTQDGELYIASGQIADRELGGIMATLTVYSQEQV